jgi:hypothetical protein
MPVDFQQIHARIVQIAPREAERLSQLQQRRHRADDLLSAHANDLDNLRRKAAIANATDSRIRLAVPANEALTFSRPCPPKAESATLIAVDGSQITPDRHAAIQFAVVNAGAVIMRLRSGEVSEVCTTTDLLYGEDLETESGMLSEDSVSLRRDLRERETLEQLSHGISGTVVTFTDGPLELWSSSGEETREVALFREKYKGVLSRLQSQGVITAGYVDKPGADLVVRLLELATMSEEQLADRQFLRTYHPFRGVDDAMLFSGQDQPWIFPGHRSAVFRLQSSAQNVYTGVLTLHFFYLNVGSTGYPWLVRVEIPQWVADDAAKLDVLHAVLVEQCEIMGYKPYPYLLHRAHETAVVRLDEKTQVEQMLTLELRRHGAPIGVRSPKQTAKDHEGRKSI